MPLGRATALLYREILIQTSTSPQARGLHPSLADASCFLPGAQRKPRILANLGTNSSAVKEFEPLGS